MIITRITQFFHLAAVHEQGSAQRNPFTLKLPSPDKVCCWGPELSSAVQMDGSEPELGIWAFPAARSRSRDAPRGRRPVRRGNAESECGCRRPGSPGRKEPRMLHRLGRLFPAIPQHPSVN